MRPVQELTPSDDLVGKPPISALVLAQEGQRIATAGRFKMLDNANGWSIPPERVLFAHRYPLVLQSQSHQKRLRETIAEHNVKFVIIDTLAKVFRGDENKSDAAGEAMRVIDSFRAAGGGATVMYIHHTRKPGEDGYGDIDEDIRGSTALPGFYDVHLAFRPVADGIELTTRFRDGAGKRYLVWWDINDEGGNYAKGHAHMHMEYIGEDD